MQIGGDSHLLLDAGAQHVEDVVRVRGGSTGGRCAMLRGRWRSSILSLGRTVLSLGRTLGSTVLTLRRRGAV